MTEFQAKNTWRDYLTQSDPAIAKNKLGRHFDERVFVHIVRDPHTFRSLGLIMSYYNAITPPHLVTRENATLILCDDPTCICHKDGRTLTVDRFFGMFMHCSVN